MKLLIPALIIFIWSFALVMVVGMDNFPPTALWNAGLNPENWSELPFVIWVSGFLAIGAVASTVIIGNLFGVAELATMALIVGVFFSYIPTLVIAFQQVSAMFPNEQLANWIAVLFISPVIIAIIMTLIEWWGNRN